MKKKSKRLKVLCVVCGNNYAGWSKRDFSSGQLFPSKHFIKDKHGDKILCIGSFISTWPIEEKRDA